MTTPVCMRFHRLMLARLRGSVSHLASLRAERKRQTQTRRPTWKESRSHRGQSKPDLTWEAPSVGPPVRESIRSAQLWGQSLLQADSSQVDWTLGSVRKRASTMGGLIQGHSQEDLRIVVVAFSKTLRALTCSHQSTKKMISAISLTPFLTIAIHSIERRRGPTHLPRRSLHRPALLSRLRPLHHFKNRITH